MNRSVTIFVAAFMTAFAGMAGVKTPVADQSLSSVNDPQGITGTTSSASDQSVSENSSMLSLSGANPVTLSPNGSVTRVSGNNVRLLPGTKISSGGFVYAPAGHVEKTGKPNRREKRLVTVEEKEKIEARQAMEKAATLISPFLVNRKGQIKSGEPADGHFMSLTYNDMAVVQENQSKTAGYYAETSVTFLKVSLITYLNVPEFRLIRTNCPYVLRL